METGSVRMVQDPLPSDGPTQRPRSNASLRRVASRASAVAIIAALVSGDIYLEPNLAAALAMLLVAFMTLITLVHQWLLRRSRHVQS